MSLNKHTKKSIKKFLDRHYKYGETGGEKVNALDVYELYKECKPGVVEINYLQFHQRAVALGVKVKRDKRKAASYYYATPLTDLSVKHHGATIATEELDDENENSYVTLNLVNIRGLITESHNKMETLDKFAKLKGGKRKILAITETHLIKGEHLKAEVKNIHIQYIQSYPVISTSLISTPRYLDINLRSRPKQSLFKRKLPGYLDISISTTRYLDIISNPLEEKLDI